MRIPILELAQQALTVIREIKPDLDRTQLFLMGPAAIEPMLERWGTLERRICSAKLAIVRDEFALRFPALSADTEGFTFGIADEFSDRYLTFLTPRLPNDILNMTFAIIEEVFGAEQSRRIPGIAHFASNLTQSLQAYSTSIENLFEPIADELGIDYEKLGRPDR